MPIATLFWPLTGSTAIYSGSGFTTPTNVHADDATYATADGSGSPGQRWGNFGFDAAITAGSTINTVTVEYQFKWSTSGVGWSETVLARVAGTPLVGHKLTSTPTSDTTITTDITADRAWTRADLLDGTFEVVVACASTVSATFSVDYVKVIVDYTGPTAQTLNIGKVGSPAAVRGVSFGLITLGHISSPSALRGVQVLQGGTSPQNLPVGKIATGETVRGVSVTQPLQINIGKIASPAAVRGVSVTQPIVVGPEPEWPTVTVQIALGNPTTTPTWTNAPVTAPLLKIETGYGRNFELDRFETGTTVLTFDNSTREWDPSYTSSSLYPNLLPLRRMRGLVTYGGLTYPLFDGYIERVNLDQTGPRFGKAEVHLVDGFEVLVNAAMATPTPTLTMSGGGGSLKLEAVGPVRGSTAFTVSVSDPYQGQHVSAPASLTFDGTTLAFGKRRTQVSATDWDSFLDAGEAARLIRSVSTAASIFRATILINGDIGGFTGGTFSSGWPQEKADVRISRALDGIGWSSDDRNLDVSLYNVQAIAFQDRNGVTAKQVADDAAAAELGQLFLSPDGKVTFKNYAARTNDPNSSSTQVVFTDSNPGVDEYTYRSLEYEYARDRIYNDILVEVASGEAAGPSSVHPLASGGGDSQAQARAQVWSGGGGILGFPFRPPVQQIPHTAYASDATSQVEFYRRSLQISTTTANAALPQILANELLRRYKDQHVRISSIEFTARGQEALWPHVLGRKVNDRILVKWTPPGATQQIATPCWIEAVKHSAGPGKVWSTVWSLSPVV